MKCSVPEISWHNREPVLSVDIHPIFNQFYRLATGGADCHVLIWQLKLCDNGSVDKEVLTDLTRHQKAVNAVRWSPNGQLLATADDDANILIWQLKTDNIPLLEETNKDDKEIWIIKKILRGHKEDVYDLAWSPTGLKLVSGSIDNTAILWDMTKFKSEQIMTDHKGFVQGVCWDPKGHYFATISTDRVCRIYDSTAKQVRARISKGLLPVPPNHCLHNKEVKFFHDDTFKSYFRRLDFSPDGSLLAAPSGRIEIDDGNFLNCTLLFAVENWASPVAFMPIERQCSAVVKFCPVLFELKEEGPDSVVNLPYRMIFAVGSDRDVTLYDTQQSAPFALLRNVHYTRLTDLTWSPDGLLLAASSSDGYCSLITFDKEELGKEYVKEDSEVEESVLNISGCEALEESFVDEEKTKKPAKPTLLEKWAIKTPKKSVKHSEASTSNESAKVKDCITIEDSVHTNKDQNEEKKPVEEEKGTNSEEKSVKKVRRIIPIKIKLQEKPEEQVEDPKEENMENSKKAVVKDLKKGKRTPSSPRKPEEQIEDSKGKKMEDSKTVVKDSKKEETPASLSRKRPLEKKHLTLLDFVKKTPKEKKLKMSTVEAPTIVLDEDERKDALSTESTADKDRVESSKLQVSENGNNTEKNSTEENKKEEKKDVEHQEEVVRSREETDKNREETNKVKEEKAPLEKPKKRVPLITLSSPKQKKTVVP